MKKFVTIILFLFAIVCGNLRAEWSKLAEPFEDDDPRSGTAAKPYIISSPEHLAHLAVMLNDPANYSDYATAYYELNEDINIVHTFRNPNQTPVLWWDLSIGASDNYPFRGHFDGKGHKISGFQYSSWFLDVHKGLFGYTDGSAVIKNLTIEGVNDANGDYQRALIGIAKRTIVDNCSIINFNFAPHENQKVVGTFINEAYGSTITNCSFSGGIKYGGIIKDKCLGGFIGKSSGKTVVTNCNFSGTIEIPVVANSFLGGGFIGETSETTVTNCSFSGDVKINSGSNASNFIGGGFIGKAFETKATNCSFSGNFEVAICTAAGFIGYVEGGEFTDCFSQGDIRGYTTGGFIGEIGKGKTTIRNCFAACTTIGEVAGGFIKTVAIYVEVDITDCRSSGSVLGTRNDAGFNVPNGASGFITEFRGWGTISRCLAETSVVGLGDYVGGFFGTYTGYNWTDITMISDCHTTGVVEGYGNSVGGFAGRIDNDNNLFIHCSSEGSVTGKDYVGGFAGYHASFHTSGTISGCYSYGDVKGKKNVGGFIGLASGTITGCYAVGNVAGNNNVGGFAGANDRHVTGNTVIANCYAVNSVEGNDAVGGFWGSMDDYSYPPPSILNCFSSGTVLGASRAGAFIGKPDIWSNNFTNCFFDRQIATVAVASGTNEVEGIAALTTSRLTNGKNPGFSESEKWVFIPGYYPELQTFAGSKDAATRLRSGLSVVPLKLSSDTEMVDNVQTFIYLMKTTPTGDAITWSADPDEMVTVKNHAVYAFASKEWRTLTLRAGKAERTVQFRPTINLITADILGVKVNGEFVDVEKFIEDDTFNYLIPCGSDDVSVFVEIIFGGYTECKPVTSMTLYVNQPHNITIETADGQEKSYIFKTGKPLPSDIFVQRWTDVLAINNNFTTNGGYIFTGYEWRKDGVEIPNTKGRGYIQDKDGFKTGVYTAVLTSQHGTVETCPAIISVIKTKAAVYPNPVQRGQTVRVETSRDAARHRLPRADGGSTMQLFDTMGNIVSKQTLNNPVVEITMPDTPGQYILQVRVNGVSETFKIVVE